MERLQKQIRFENENIGSLTFYKQQYLVVAHGKKLSISSIHDNFTNKVTVDLPW